MAIGRATIAILGLLAITGQLWSGQEPAVAARPGEHCIHFRARNGLIFIPARVNGNRVTLLLDTGAALTTFSLKIVPEVNVNSKITMNMASGSVSAYRVPVAFTVGEPDLDERRCSFRQTAVVGDFKFGEADGVIGLDVLSSFRGVTIDFQHSVLILVDR
ncbi:MAG TPA: retropepsin-like aspartic protease [Terriglobales bacterium]|nr:retropepsin-like aspartic protease [Terriglobales bacterium]